jgi:hypothetical protein
MRQIDQAEQHVGLASDTRSHLWPKRSLAVWTAPQCIDGQPTLNCLSSGL